MEEVNQKVECINETIKKTLDDSRLTDIEKARSLGTIIAQQKESMKEAYSQLDNSPFADSGW